MTNAGHNKSFVAEFKQQNNLKINENPTSLVLKIYIKWLSTLGRDRKQSNDQDSSSQQENIYDNKRKCIHFTKQLTPIKMRK